MAAPLTVLDVGSEVDGAASRARFPGATCHLLDLKLGWDVMQRGLPDGPWDIIFASHFIEHILDPDFFLTEARRVSASHTRLIIETPNLAAWYNRLLLLGGYVPHLYEVSTQYNVGKVYDGSQEKLAGHVRLFTPRALQELLIRHGFRVLSLRGKPTGYPLALLRRHVPAPLAWSFRLLDGACARTIGLAAFFEIQARRVCSS